MAICVTSQFQIPPTNDKKVNRLNWTHHSSSLSLLINDSSNGSSYHAWAAALPVKQRWKIKTAHLWIIFSSDCCFFLELLLWFSIAIFGYVAICNFNSRHRARKEIALLQLAMNRRRACAWFRCGWWAANLLPLYLTVLVIIWRQRWPHGCFSSN